MGNSTIVRSVRIIATTLAFCVAFWAKADAVMCDKECKACVYWSIVDPANTDCWRYGLPTISGGWFDWATCAPPVAWVHGGAGDEHCEFLSGGFDRRKYEGCSKACTPPMEAKNEEFIEASPGDDEFVAAVGEQSVRICVANDSP
jgi:hypothetical protein